MSTEENKAIVRRFWEEIFKGNLDVIDELVSPDYVQYMPEKTNAFGSKGLKAMFQEHGTFYSDQKTTILDLLADGDKVVLRVRNEYTHTGDLPTPWGGSIPPTGKRLHLTETIIFQIADGKIVADWGVADNTASLMQLGLLRPPA
jgi:predicted ester cyclase